MSTRPPAPASLLAGWIDDAAVFPPGSSPVELAWTDHLDLRAGGYADLVGPLLVRPGDVPGLVSAAGSTPAPDRVVPVAVAVVARAGTTVDEVLAAAQELGSSDHVVLAGVEVWHEADGWQRLLDLGVRVVVEVPREGQPMVDALGALSAAREQAPGRVVAKLRTQATAQAPAPSPRQLAEFMMAAHSLGLPFKLTGGMHRALAHGEEQDGSFEHGCLNVLVATHHLLGGAGLRSLGATLEMGDGDGLASLASGLGEQEARAVREAFVSFGCCGVLDPVGDLASLGLVAAPPQRPGTPHTPLEEDPA